jgi:hypothetical protein
MADINTKLLKANPDDPNFISAIKNLKEGDKIEISDAILIVEGKFEVPTHFPFHQRVFDPGMILRVEGRNTRIYVEAEKLGMKAVDTPEGFNDRQIKDGEVLPADPGTQAKE